MGSYDHWIHIGVRSYSFVTCYSKDVITFDFYITPFQPELWIALATTYLSLGLALVLWVFREKVKGSFCPWMYVLGALLEDGVPLPEKIERNSVFRVVFGCWIIVCVFLSNCYNGLMITDLNAPLQTTSVITFRDLVCNWRDVKYSYEEYKNMTINSTLHPFSFDNFNIMWYAEYVYQSYSRRGWDKSNVTENPYSSSSTSKACFSILSFPHEMDYVPKFFDFLYNLFVPYYKDGFVSHLKTQELQVNLFHPKKRHYPRNITIQKKLNYTQQLSGLEKDDVDCGKTVFAAPPDELEAEIEYLSRKYPMTKFYKSKDTVKAKPYGIGIFNPECSNVPRNADALMESGIYSRLMREKHLRKNFKRERARVYKPRKDNMTIDGCISTFFLFCVVD